MRGIILMDTGKNIVTRAVEEAAGGRIGGVLLSAPLTPPSRRSGRGKRDREDIGRCLDEITDAGAEVMLDALTHIVTQPSVNAGAIYDSWDLWAPGQFGQVGTKAQRRDHVERVINAQASAGVVALGPTLCLDSPVGTASNRCRELAEFTMDLDKRAWLTVAGTSSFWGSGPTLDAHVGAIVQLRPAGVVLAVVRPNANYPGSGATAAEVSGLARTTRTASPRGPVVVSHGDLAALPAVAAGAVGVGSGFDVRQRVLSPASFRPATGGSYSFRVPFPGLLAAFARADSRRLFEADPTGARALAGGPMPSDEKRAYQRHFDMLRTLMGDLESMSSDRARAYRMRDLYTATLAPWSNLASRPQAGRTEWIDPFRAGHDTYIAEEGW
jgi:hypothetical protein